MSYDFHALMDNHPGGERGYTPEDEAYLISKGWTKFETMIGYKDRKFPIRIWKKEGNLGMSAALAMGHQHGEDIEAEKKAIYEEGKPVLCNKCGEDTRYMEDEECHGHYGLIHATVGGGFGSTHVPDASDVQFSLCEKCVAELCSTFKIPPRVYFRGF